MVPVVGVRQEGTLANAKEGFGRRGGEDGERCEIQERRKMRRNLKKWTGGMIKGKTLNHIFIFS